MKSEGSSWPTAQCYFTCTLSEALEFNKQRGASFIQTVDGTIVEHEAYQNINEFVDHLANGYGKRIALGCATRSKSAIMEGSQADLDLLNFEDIRLLSCQVSKRLQDRLGQPTPENGCIALLASSSPVFLLIWLGLIRAGFRVLLVAPQSSPRTVGHLLKLSGSKSICFDARNAVLVRDFILQSQDSSDSDERTSRIAAINASWPIDTYEIPWPDLRSLQSDLRKSDSKVLGSRSSIGQKPSSIAFFFHSSGTTGPPKLIPQTHHGAVGILPLLQEYWSGNDVVLSAFTTTPLYHGGIADLFRSWSAAAPLWIFTEGRTPITAASIEDCIRRIDNVSNHAGRSFKSKLDYFSCVPFVLESATDNEWLMQRLRSLAAVGVGGAVMPKELGDALAREGIRLVSRFGSSECGFLLSSMRDFESDHGWDVLRLSSTSPLEFRPFAEGQQELIVPESWPLVCTAAHARRPFNTHDLFSRHGKLTNAWSYTGRSDMRLTLKTGEKFDPMSMEAALRKSEYICEALVLGEGRSFPAALIFISSQMDHLPRPESETEIWKHVQSANSNAPKHAKLSRQAISLLSASQSNLLPKNNKGGVIRSAASAEFNTEIMRLYGELEAQNQVTELLGQSLQGLSAKIEVAVKEQLEAPDKIGPDDDLFEAGLDSAGAVRIRNTLVGMMPQYVSRGIPLNVAFECGSIKALITYCQLCLESDSQLSENGEDSQGKYKEMKAMVAHYSKLQSGLLREISMPAYIADQKRPTNKCVVLTGGTGFLGVHVLSELLRDTSVTKIYVLVRRPKENSPQTPPQDVRHRVKAALSYHRLIGMSPEEDDNLSKTIFTAADLKKENLGIEQDVYNEIAKKVTHIVHAAWEVNFNLPLRAFSTQLRGTIGLFNLAAVASRRSRQSSSNVAFIFCSSVASIANVPHRDLGSVRISANPRDAAQIGYGQSKWVAEKILQSVSSKEAGIEVTIIRIGQLGGNSRTGIWNPREAWPLMFHASRNILHKRDQRTPCKSKTKWLMPDLSHTSNPMICWLPVDIAAKVLCEQVFNTHDATSLNIDTLMYQRRGPAWKDVQTWMMQWGREREEQIQFTSPSAWLEQLETHPASHPAKALVPLWRTNWQIKHLSGKMPGATAEQTTSYRDDMRGMTGAQFRIGEKYIYNILDWIASLAEVQT